MVMVASVGLSTPAQWEPEPVPVDFAAVRDRWATGRSAGRDRDGGCQGVAGDLVAQRLADGGGGAAAHHVLVAAADVRSVGHRAPIGVLPDGAGATLVRDGTTSTAARTRGRGRSGPYAREHVIRQIRVEGRSSGTTGSTVIPGRRATTTGVTVPSLPSVLRGGGGVTVGCGGEGGRHG